MTSVALAPDPVFKAFDNNGAPLNNGRLFSFIAGSSTPQATYPDSTGTTPNTNPIILNARGEANVWLATGLTYKLTLQDSLGNQIWSVDQIPGGTNAATVNATTLNGIPGINYARQSRTAAEISAGTVVQNTYTGVTNAYPYATATFASNTIINCQSGDSQILTLTGNITMGAPINPADGQQIDLLVVQDGSGNRTVTWNAIFLFEGGTPPLLSTVGGGVDRFLLKYNAALNKFVVGHFIGSTTGTQIVIQGNASNFNLFAALGNPASPLTATVNVGPGIVISATDTSISAMDMSGLPSGSTINLINNGYIIGRGGDGANGAIANFPGSGATNNSANLAGAGGPAINGPGTGITFNITNAAGHIWGGGGGGGGSGAFDGNPSGNGLGNGAGAGGGAGGGKGGAGATGVFISGGSTIATNGVPGSPGINGTGGAAGTGTSSGFGQVGTAGAGGNYGVAGTTGTNPATTTVGHFGAFSAGGAAGKAIALNGGAATFVSGSGSPNVLGAVS